MTITIFGSLFLPLTLVVFLFRRRWLVSLLCVAAVLQGPSVANLALAGGIHGITPFLAVSALLLADLALSLRHRRLPPMSAQQRRLAQLWLGFFALSVAGALLLPWCFAGVPVHSPLARGGAQADPVALRFSLSNIAQVVNALLIAAAMGWVWLNGRDPALPRRMLLGVIVAVGVAALVGLQQRLAWNGLLPLGEAFWASNPSYEQNFRTFAGPLPRVSWPFIEPSYGSAWYAAILGGFVAMFLSNYHRHLALLGLLTAAFALANSMGATGLIASGAYLAIVLVVVAAGFWRHPALRGAMSYRLLLAAIVLACVGLAGYLTLRHYGLLEVSRLAFEQVLAGRSETLLGDLRPHADRHALDVVRATWGLGAGMGGNRASSYLATLLSTVGIPGLVLFLAAFGYQLHLLAKVLRSAPGTPAVFFLGSGAAALLAVSIAIPDQNWPAFWILIVGGFACVSQTRRQPAQPPQ